MTTALASVASRPEISHDEMANAIRFLAIDAVEQAKSGHPGMPMGMADIAEVLWNDHLSHNPANPQWVNRDRFVLSNGHGSMLQYALLHLSGYDLPIEELKNFRQLGSRTAGHPERHETPGVETTTGPLGQGFANALAACAAAHALGISLGAMVEGLQNLQPVKGRAVAQLAPNGVRVIDDSYNANPVSMCAAVDILAGFSGRTVLVLGDMGELGEWAEQGHRDVGAHAAGKVDALYAVGPLMVHAVTAFGEKGRHFAEQASLIDALRGEAGDTTILIKGSRSAAMDKVVDALPKGSTGKILKREIDPS